MPRPSPVELERVSVRRGGSLILRDLDLVVEPAEVVAVRGQNGSGKTTLLRLISTLLAPTSGKAHILGVDAADRQAVLGYRHRIGLIGHDPALWPELTLEENISVLPNLRRLGRPALDEAMGSVGLAGARRRRADRSSLGMKRRVEFARIRLDLPDLLLLDEAHAGLDAGAAALVEDTALLVQARGGSVIVVAHDVTRMQSVLSRTLNLVDGRLEPAP